MLNIPGMVLGTWVLNNPTYPFFLPSEDFLFQDLPASIIPPDLNGLLVDSQAQGPKSPIFASEASLVLPSLNALCSNRSSCLHKNPAWRQPGLPRRIKFLMGWGLEWTKAAVPQGPSLSTTLEGRNLGHTEP